MMKTLLCTLILATLGTTAAKADDITISFDQPNQTAGPGQTIEFFGTITNNSNTTVYLNTDDLNLAGLGFSTTDQFFSTVPPSLAASGQPGDSSGDIELFDVTLDSPFTGTYETVLGGYTLFGGADADAQDNLTTTGFSVTPVPEPSSIYLLFSGVAGLVPISRRLRKQGS